MIASREVDLAAIDQLDDAAARALLIRLPGWGETPIACCFWVRPPARLPHRCLIERFYAKLKLSETQTPKRLLNSPTTTAVSSATPNSISSLRAEDRSPTLRGGREGRPKCAR